MSIVGRWRFLLAAAGCVSAIVLGGWVFLGPESAEPRDVAAASTSNGRPFDDTSHSHAASGAPDVLRGGEGPKPFIFEEGHDHASEPCEPTPEEQAAADRLLADVKGSIATFADPEHAEDLGFRRFGDVAIQGTWHYINWAWQADETVLDPRKPESIVYWQANVDAPMIPIGFMFIVPRLDDHGPPRGGCLTRWHVHGPPFAAAGELTAEMLHVWTIPMPNGPFV